MKKFRHKFIFLVLFVLSFIGIILARDVRRHGSFLIAIDSWFYTPLFDLNDKNACYQLQPGPLIVKKEGQPSVQKLPNVPEGMIMEVAGSDFDMERYFGVCHQFKGYFTLRAGRAKWYLTEVVR